MNFLIVPRFVDQYLELHEKKSVPTEHLFEETVRILKEGGVKLITHEERRDAQKVGVLAVFVILKD